MDNPIQEQDKIIEIINTIRQEFMKYANGEEGIKFENAIHNTYSFATDWIDE